MSAAPRSQSWTLTLCGVLFFATFINYADRVVVTQNSVHLKTHFQTDDAGYGNAEGKFGFGFAMGGLIFGVLADLISIRWLYPAVVIAWSFAGYRSAHAGDLVEFGWWRFALGCFEAGHWPCALRMTQRSFPPDKRTWGNGILQAGAAGGQILVPQLIVWLAVRGSGWQSSFELAAVAAIPWVAAWLLLVRETDVRRPVLQTTGDSSMGNTCREIQEIPWYRIVMLRRWWLLLLTVVCINVPWHALRVWMPDTLQLHYGYSKEFVDRFTSYYYVSTLIGSVSTGWLVGRLAKSGKGVHRSRLIVFGVCAGMVALLAPAMLLPAGSLLLGLQLVVAFGTLGVAPIYYSLNQEISGKAQGKVGGSLSFLLWCILGQMQSEIGGWIKGHPEDRPVVFAVVAVLPLIALTGLAWGWNRNEE